MINKNLGNLRIAFQRSFCRCFYLDKIFTFRAVFFLCSKLTTCWEDMKLQVSYFTKADKTRRCALQGRNCKEVCESIIQILGHFRPIWNTRTISNKEKVRSTPQSPYPVAPHCIGDTWMPVPSFPSALTVALLPFYLSLLPLVTCVCYHSGHYSRYSWLQQSQPSPFLGV